MAGGLAVAGCVAALERAVSAHLRRFGALLLRADDLERRCETLEAENSRLRSSSRLRTGLPPGTPVPEFRLPRVGGGALTHEDLLGQVTVLAFLDPNCPPCDRLAPDLERLHRDPAAPRIVAISRGSEHENRVMQAAGGLTFPMAMQPHWDVSRRFGTLGVPGAVLIDRRGLIRSDLAVGGVAVGRLLASLPTSAAP